TGIPNLFGSLAVLGPWRYVLIPAVGGIFVGIYVMLSYEEVAGHGTDRTLEALLVKGGHIETPIAFHKIIASAVAIASGGSLGREGPIVQIGSAVGAYFSRFVHSRYRRILVAAGAGAGIAGTFNAPLAGLLFAIEVLLVEYEIRSLIAIGIASAMAVVVARPLLGYSAVLGTMQFQPSHPLHVVDPLVEYPLYIVLGLIASVVGSLEVTTLYGVDDFFERLDLPYWVKPGIGGALLGGTILIAAYMSHMSNVSAGGWLFGVGYGTIHAAVTSKFTLGVLLLFAVMKIVGFALSIGSGSSGGVFSPSLFIGTMVGGAFGLLVQGIPGTASPAAYALVGMAGVFAATARAPLTATLITVELSGQYTLILPLIIVCVLGSEITDTFTLNGTIYTEALNRMGYDIHNRRIGSIEDFAPSDVMTPAAELETVTPGTPARDAIQTLSNTSQRALPVVEDGRLQGIITPTDFTRMLEGGSEVAAVAAATTLSTTEQLQKCDDMVVEDVETREVITVLSDSNLLESIHKMETRDVRQIPVVDEDDGLVGMISRQNILHAYDRSLLK
ncbi:MAG: chloride channel protein, partial [Salinigranum sp.]